MNRLVTVLSLAVLALAAAGCGAKEQTAGDGTPQPLRVMLDYLPNADHAGIYAAEARGEFARAGLDVELITPADPAAPLRQLQAGRVDLAITYEPELLLARDQGTNLIGVASLVNTPLTSIIAIEGSGIRRVEDLQGKTIGTAGIPYQDAYLDTILRDAGVTDVRRVNVGFNLTPAMISERVDATLGSFWNVEGVELQRRDLNPTILRVDELGIPTYDELLFAAKRESLDPELASRIRRFVQALQRGTEAVREDPAVGAEALVAAESGLNRETVIAQIEATLPAFFPRNPQAPFGFMDVGAWDRYTAWMRENGLLEQPTANSDPITTEFLPGQGLPDPERP